MIPALRTAFNAGFTSAKYKQLLQRMNERCGTEIHFRVCETPVFIPPDLSEKLTRYGRELVYQLLDDKEYRRASDLTIPAKWNVPNDDADPLWMCVDFGLVRAASGEIEPKLVELQAFPSLYGYQTILSEEYLASYGIQGNLSPYLDGLDVLSYRELLSRVVVGEHKRENVVLLEIDRRLFYLHEGHLTPIERIYNRCIVDELERKQIVPPFDYRDELDIEWAGHPNWYYRISKFSIPWLKHACVPRTWYLDHALDSLSSLSVPREDLLLKPLYSFAGAGIVFAPTDEQLYAIPQAHRHDYILQERIAFTPLVETPHGATQAEIRVMYIWPPGESMRPVLLLARMGRGKMMGVDHNRNLEWVGGSAGLVTL